ncbi:MAG: signal recognition particle-docking protein FtsY [Planctomycetota bacterium]|nr:signal recognition particle-docking protein FtsY [Planctomycetota bacterium]
MVLRFIKGVVEKLKGGLSKARGLFSAIFGRSLSEETINMVEEALFSADIGVSLTTLIIEELKERYKKGEFKDTDSLMEALKEKFVKILESNGNELRLSPSPPTVVLVVGVNGSGKTTSIAKLAHYLATEKGMSVVVAACDTFRAAAIEQLEKWCERVQSRLKGDKFCRLIKHETGSDPAAVAYDATDAAIARRADVLIIDTAGRMHTKVPLMEELRKLVRVVQKKIPDAPHEVLLVLDATTGQNGISQAEKFREAVPLTGIFLAKLDGTAKGGIVVAIKERLGIPVKFAGIGEKLEDIAKFDVASFAEALLGR